MNEPPLRITYLTAGAAGMYCGSCMHDNTLARALVKLGIDVQLVPMYTPIQVDEQDASQQEVFFGGINVYLQQRFRLFRWLPRFLDRALDRPGLLRWIGSRGIETKAHELGGMAVSMLKGSNGFQRKEVARLCQWLGQGPRPHLINLSNILVAGCVPDLRAQLQAPVTVTLQGDDIFLEQLPAEHRSLALAEIKRVAESVDAFLVHSDYYARFMADYLSLPREKFHQVPLGIDVEGFAPRPIDAKTAPPKKLQIGYLARLAPEKGLHVLVDACIQLQQLPERRGTFELKIAGWLGKQHEAYANQQFRKLEAASVPYQYLGAVDRVEKQSMLSQLDVFSVPAVYREPKGLYVLEALAAGAPVVLPNHGAFPEIVRATAGGILVTPDDPAALAAAIHQVLGAADHRQQLSTVGQQNVLERFHAQAMAQQTLDILRQIIGNAARD